MACDYAQSLLVSLGARVARSPGARDPHPDIAWARSGAMALTGYAQGPPRLAPGPLASAAWGTLGALQTLVGGARTLDLDAGALLGERAALLGLHRGGRISPGGSCRLLRTADGWLALNLPRPDDIALLSAWLGEGEQEDPWAFAAERLARSVASEAVARARLLGLAVALAVEPPARPPGWCRVTTLGKTAAQRRGPPLVVDLSVLWAGPLCTHLLAQTGARVLKIESSSRPDGARAGAAAFFDLMNAGKASVTLDFDSEAGRAQLRALLECADIVVESARPRALAQLGIDAEELIRSRSGLTWLGISGYGRREPGAGWIAFGDDAAVAAGLACATGARDAPLFCGDAIADPLTGLHAALAALASYHSGGGHLLDLALCDVTAHALCFDAPASEASVVASDDDEGWEVVVRGEREQVAGPCARKAPAPARPFGVDTEDVLEELGIRC